MMHIAVSGVGLAVLKHVPCRQITKDTLSVLLADELIAVNQDPLGVPGDLIWKQGSDEVMSPAGPSVMRVLQSQLACHQFPP
jgi:hypothetical protein